MQILAKGATTAAYRRIPFVMLDSNGNAVTDLSFSGSDITVRKNGGSVANAAGTVTEMEDGMYYYQATTGELDTEGFLIVRVVKTGAITFRALCQVVDYDPYNNQNLGLGALPTSGVVLTSVGNVIVGGYATGQDPATSVWGASTRTLTDFAFNVTVSSLTSPALSSIENQVWDALLSHHTTANSFGVGVNLNLSQNVPVSDVSAKTTQTVGDCLSVARADGAGSLVLSGTVETVYGPDGSQVVRTFNLNDAINPTQRT